MKNAYLTSQKSVGRKLFEAALAWQLEQRWTKDQILTAYLNTVYFGNGAYGVQQASQIYFHHSREDDEAGRGGAARRHSRGPEPVGPGRTPEDGEGAPQLRPPRSSTSRATSRTASTATARTGRCPTRRGSLPSTQGVAAPYFANYVKDQLVRQYGPRRTFGGGLRVKTTLDVDLQQAARDAI